MAAVISNEDQISVNHLRIDLAQALIDLTEVQPNASDHPSRTAKDRVINGLRKVRQNLDHLGIVHCAARQVLSKNQMKDVIDGEN